MGFLDKAKNLINQHDDKVDQALDKAGEAAKGRFGGHGEHIDRGVDRLQQMTGSGDTTAEPPAGDGAQAAQSPPVPAGEPGQTVPGGPGHDGPNDPTGGYERAPEVPGGPETDVPAGPGHVPPQQ